MYVCMYDLIASRIPPGQVKRESIQTVSITQGGKVHYGFIMEITKTIPRRAHMAPREDGTQIVTRKPRKWSPKTFKIEAQTLQNRAQLNQEGSRTTPKPKSNIYPTKKRAALHRPSPILEETVANMAPSWLPKSIKN